MAVFGSYFYWEGRRKGWMTEDSFRWKDVRWISKRDCTPSALQFHGVLTWSICNFCVLGSTQIISSVEVFTRILLYSVLLVSCKNTLKAAECNTKFIAWNQFLWYLSAWLTTAATVEVSVCLSLSTAIIHYPTPTLLQLYSNQIGNTQLELLLISLDPNASSLSLTQQVCRLLWL